ncbi:MAG: HAD-IA family hydrolase [Propionibacteriaceae bacterium]|nr:HAD-IA family hydrolase [Propionibacteriaceae bacterium]
MRLQALVFDCDGVLGDTERDGHLPAFNQTFAEFGIPVEWSVERYAELVKIGGGKERMNHALTDDDLRAAGLDPADRADIIARLHKRKSAVFQELVQGGAVPPRPGIRRLIHEALDLGLKVAVASTSAEASVAAVLRTAVGEEAAARCVIRAGDIVERKKPAPDIYLAALEAIGVDAEHAVAVEDTDIGLAAARAAGLVTVITQSALTQPDEDFTGAAMVLPHLGDDITVAALDELLTPDERNPL